MIEGIDVDIGWFTDFLIGEGTTLQGWITTIALLAISWSFRTLNGRLSETNVSIIRLDKTLDESTDAIIDNTKSMDESNRNFKDASIKKL